MFDKRIQHGIIGGLAGGVVFGMMMAKMGMLPMIGRMVGQPNAAVGFLVHLAVSASIGAGYGLLAGRRFAGPVASLVSGGVYGAIWWVLGPLTMMPLMMGMGLGVNWHAAAAQQMLPSLMGHVLFGLVLGWVYRRSTAGRFRRAGAAPADAPPRAV